MGGKSVMDSVREHPKSIIKEEDRDKNDKGDYKKLYARSDLDMYLAVKI